MTKPTPHEFRSGGPAVEALAKSQMWLDYQRAFTKGTRLPLAMQEPGEVHLIKYGSSPKNRFCVLIAKTNKACAACYALQQELEHAARLEPKTLTSPAQRSVHADAQKANSYQSKPEIGFHVKEDIRPYRVGQKLVGA